MQTYKRVFCAVAIALCAAPIDAMAADPRPCELFSTKEVASVLGGTPERGQPGGPDHEVGEVGEYPGATRWTCILRGGESYFIPVVVRFRSAADATRGMTKDAKLFKSSPESYLGLSEVPGPGEQNLWGSSSEDGAIWISRKGQTVLAVVLAGKIKQHESLREPIQDLVASGLRRLP